MPAQKTSAGPRPSSPPTDWTFPEALQFLRSQTYPAAPKLVFLGSRKEEDINAPWDFSDVWSYFEKTSGGKTTEERLGAWASVLERHEESSSAPVRYSEEDAPSSTTSEGSASEDDLSPEEPSPPLSIPAPPLPSARSRRIPQPATPIQTGPRFWFTTDANAIFNSHLQFPTPNSFDNIYPITYQTHPEKKSDIAVKLRNKLTNGPIDPEICPIYSFNPLNPREFARLHSKQGGLHIFIDISNIVLSWKDVLKRTRRIPDKFHIPQPPFSFSDFAFILERCRPTTRRIIVGSKTNGRKQPYHVEAEFCGYEVNLLERVSKARVTPAARRVFTPTGYGSASDAPIGAPKVNVEQGVDEILQMKMLESLVDTQAPSTIVLATGDAAVAEYSGGFALNVKRALMKGWKVEVVGWSANMGQAWTRLEKAWVGQLRIILLDDMAEDLLAWYAPE